MTRPRSSSPRTASRSRWPVAVPTSASCARSAGSSRVSPAPSATGSPGKAVAVHRTSRGSSPTFSTSWTDLHRVRRGRRHRRSDRVHLRPSRSALRSRRRGQNRPSELGMNMIRVADGRDRSGLRGHDPGVDRGATPGESRAPLPRRARPRPRCLSGQLLPARRAPRHPAGRRRSGQPPERQVSPHRRSFGEVCMESPLPVTQADAVVIGAGAFGLSAGYQLAAHGAGQVVVLDRFAPGSQTSPRAAGLYKLVQADETLTRLSQSSIEMIRGFSEATGIPLSFVAVGQHPGRAHGRARGTGRRGSRGVGGLGYRAGEDRRGRCASHRAVPHRTRHPVRLLRPRRYLHRGASIPARGLHGGDRATRVARHRRSTRDRHHCGQRRDRGRLHAARRASRRRSSSMRRAPGRAASARWPVSTCRWRRSATSSSSRGRSPACPRRSRSLASSMRPPICDRRAAG